MVQVLQSLMTLTGYYLFGCRKQGWTYDGFRKGGCSCNICFVVISRDGSTIVLERDGFRIVKVIPLELFIIL